MGKPQKTIELLWGIPGSGKSTYAKQWQGHDGCRSRIDVDSIFKNSDPSKMFVNLKREVQDVIYRTDGVIIDGLVTTNAVAKQIFDELSTISNSFDLVFKIIWWERDVEAALHNDKYRPGRKLKSDITIENLPFEKPDMKILGEYVKDRVTRKRIVRKPYAEVWICENVSCSDGNILRSDAWCLGGTWGSCWGDKGTVSPEAQPTAFKAFDELLEKLCPNISFMQYKSIYNETVKIVEDGYGDYYGGYRNNAHFECDLVKLYEMLSERGLITPAV